jgi:hypothetical protein
MRFVLAVTIGLLFGVVGAYYVNLTPEITPAQRAARTSLRWCPPDSHVQCAAKLNSLNGVDGPYLDNLR